MIITKNIILKGLLRIGVFMTFFGHGVYAITDKPEWLNYIMFFGVDLVTASSTLVFIGYLDVIVAFVILFKPNKYFLLWATFWAFSTALIRPISGEPFLEFIERGANWIAPLALFFLYNYNMNNK
jgi:hypothetical protein